MLKSIILSTLKYIYFGKIIKDLRMACIGIQSQIHARTNKMLLKMTNWCKIMEDSIIKSWYLKILIWQILDQ